MRQDTEILALRTAEDVQETAERLLGSKVTKTGIVHVTAVWDGGAGLLFTLDINSETPPCHHDFFLLNLCRARADAIVTTGQILRREPELSHALQGPAEVPRALRSWRERYLGKITPPVSLVITSGRGLDFEHPLFTGWTRPLVYTSLEGHWTLESQAMSHGVEVAGVEQPSPAGAVELLRREFGAATILIEAGPSTSLQLYEPRLQIDELVLSTFSGHRLPESVQGKPFLDVDHLEKTFPHRTPEVEIAAESGPWTIRRYSRG